MHIKLLLVEKDIGTATEAANLLTSIHNITLCGIANSSGTCIELIELYEPDAIFLELDVEQGHKLRFPTMLKKQYPHIHLIIYTNYDYVPFFNQLIEYGVSGMLHRSASTDDIMTLLCMVMHGKTIIPLHLHKHIKLHRPDHLKHYWEFDLTPTERYILELIMERSTNALIAKKVHLSESSVEKYLRKIYDKLGVRNKAEALKRIKNDRRVRTVSQQE